jgi:hypothetical protein
MQSSVPSKSKSALAGEHPHKRAAETHHKSTDRLEVDVFELRDIENSDDVAVNFYQFI